MKIPILSKLRPFLRPFLVPHTPYEKKSYPEEKFFVSVIVYEETCGFSYPKHGYEEFLVRRVSHKEWPKHSKLE
jgi:hypothetical protein